MTHFIISNYFRNKKRLSAETSNQSSLLSGSNRITTTAELSGCLHFGRTRQPNYGSHLDFMTAKKAASSLLRLHISAANVASVRIGLACKFTTSSGNRDLFYNPYHPRIGYFDCGTLRLIFPLFRRL